jgi:hypothetical protein
MGLDPGGLRLHEGAEVLQQDPLRPEEPQEALHVVEAAQGGLEEHAVIS